MNNFTRTFFAALCMAHVAKAQTDQQKITAVLLAEARGEGVIGMSAVAEVIHQRSLERHWTCLKVVTQHHAFSCLNKTTPEKLYEQRRHDPELAAAMGISAILLWHPENITHHTRGANHYHATTMAKPPLWAIGKKPTAVIGHHAFYRL
jgi:spore germination cell wall hydrolase CwlJ-like protein